MLTDLRHLCLIYEGLPSQYMSIVVPHFLRAFGMKRRCLFMGGPAMMSSTYTALTWTGIDVQEERRKGSIVFSSDQTHLIDGRFEIEHMLDLLKDGVRQSLKDGFSGLWATGDMTWEMGSDHNLQKLLKYECSLEQMFHLIPGLSGICQYSKDTLPLHILGDALMTHPSVYINHTLHRANPFFKPPEEILKKNPGPTEAMDVLGMLKQMESVA